MKNNKANPTEILQSNSDSSFIVWEQVLGVDTEGYNSNSSSRDEIPERCQELFKRGYTTA